MIFAQLEHLEEYWVYRGKVDALMHGKCHRYLSLPC